MRPFRRLGSICQLLCFLAPGVAAKARAQAMPHAVAVGCVTEEDAPEAPCGHVHAGLLRLLYQARRRTSVDLDPNPVVQPRLLAATPLVVWTGSKEPAPFSPAENRALQRFLRGGGTLLVDAADGDPHSPFVAAMGQRLGHLLHQRVQKVPQDHVLFRAFYLLSAQALATDVGDHDAPEALFLGANNATQRLAVLLLRRDLLGHLADGRDGAQRPGEMDLRLAINWLMVGLCGDYKNDQVHLPFLLERRK